MDRERSEWEANRLIQVGLQQRQKVRKAPKQYSLLSWILILLFSWMH